MNEIEVNDVGPVANLCIPVAPGVTVLRGRNGSGKSTALRGVSRMLGGDPGDLSARDGAKRGEITFGEAALAITRSRTSVRGEIEVASIEGRLDIGSLVDPGIADPEKADAKRIKTLVALSGAAADPTLFYPLCGGAEGYTALAIDDKTPDLLLLGARVKRALEAQARIYEDSAKSYTSDVRALEKAIDGVDLDAECDERTLADNYARAKSLADGMVNHNEHAAKARDDASEAAALLDQAEDDCENAAALRGDARICRQQAEAKLTERNELRERIAALEAEARQLIEQATGFEGRIESAERNAAARAKLRERAAAAVPAPHTAESIEAAEAAVESAQAAMEAGAKIRLARQHAAEAKRKAELAKANTQAGRKYRGAACAVDDSLSSLLPNDCPLRIEGGRLVTATDRSQSELYSDLSLGERWILAIGFAARQLPDGGLLTLDQVAWEGLDPDNRRLVASEAHRLGVAILTAEAADCELEAEPFAMGGGSATSEAALDDLDAAIAEQTPAGGAA